jgi:hypothetical protein
MSELRVGNVNGKMQKSEATKERGKKQQTWTAVALQAVRDNPLSLCQNN